MSINSTRPGGTVGGLTPTGQEVVTNKDIDGTTASNTSRITMPKASTGVLAALTRKQGTVVYDTTANSLLVDDGTNLNAIGGGAGELNMVSVGSSSATGWTAATGATVGTTSTAGDLPLASMVSTALQITSGTGISTESTLAQTNRYSFTTPASYAVKTKVELWMRPGTNFANNEWTVSIYAGSTRQALTTDSSSFTYLPNANGKFTTYFDAVASTAYTVRFTRTVNGGTNAAVLNVANVIVGPGIQPQGAVVGSGISYTPTFNGFGTVTSPAVKWFRTGSRMKVSGRFVMGTTTATQARMYLPAGVTASTSTGAYSVVGSWKWNDGGALAEKTGPLGIGMGADYVTFGRDNYSTSASVETGYDGSVLFTSNTIYIEFEVEIADWAGSGTVNLAQNDVAYYYPTGGTWGTAGAVTCSIGQGGVLLGSTAVAGTLFAWTMTPPTPVPIGARPRIDISGDGIHWFPPSGVNIENLRDDGTNYIGAGVALLNSGDISLQFGKYPSGVSAAWTQPAPAYLRVVIELPGQAVGFGAFQAASSTNPAGISGLVPALGLPGRTDGVAVAAGYVGERINFSRQTVTVSSAATSYSNSTPVATLTPGIWLIMPRYYLGVAATTMSLSVSTSSTPGVGNLSDALQANGDAANRLFLPGNAFVYTATTTTPLYGQSYCYGPVLFASSDVDGVAIRIV